MESLLQRHQFPLDNHSITDKIKRVEPSRPPLKDIVFVTVLFLVAGLLAHGQSFSLYSVSNTSPANTQPTSDIQSGMTTRPMIEMKDVPASKGINELAKQANIKFTFDPLLLKWWAITNDAGSHIHEPLLNFSWTNLSAQDAFDRVLQDNGLVMAQNLLAMDSEITMKDGTAMDNDLGLVSNPVPLIEFKDVPLTVALENLARQASINYLLDPYIGYGQPDNSGQLVIEPTVTHTWKNITAEKAFNILCLDFHFTAIKDSGVTFIRAKDHEIHFVQADYNPDDTNIIPLIQFRGVPLSIALGNLARQAGIKYILDPRINFTDPNPSGPQLSIEWRQLTATHAFTALCENYDLNIVTNSDDSTLRVEPDNGAP